MVAMSAFDITVGVSTTSWLIATIVFSVRTVRQPVKKRKDLYKDWDARPDGLTEEVARSVLGERVNESRQSSKRLTNNFRIHMMLVTLSVLALLQPPNAPLKFLDQEVEAKSLYPLLVIALLYLWCDFGYLLSKAIDNRSVAWQLLAHTEANDGIVEASIYSGRPFLEAGVFLDAYFNVFRDEHLAQAHGVSGYYRLMLLLHGLVYGLSHACVLAMLCVTISVAAGQGWLLTTAGCSFAVILVGAFYYTHYVFCFHARHKNRLQHVIFVVATFATPALSYMPG